MKFTCEQCGKRFASVDDPAPGRVYRIKCKCGNVIHISSPHADAVSDRGPGAAPARPRITGAMATGAAIPPVPATARSAISAGDATTRVTPTATPARVVDPAVPRRTEALARAATAATPVKPQLAEPVASPQRAETVSPAPQRAALTAAARALTGLTPAARVAADPVVSAAQGAGGPPPASPPFASAPAPRSVTLGSALPTPVESPAPAFPPPRAPAPLDAAPPPASQLPPAPPTLDLFSDPFAAFPGGSEPSQTMPMEPASKAAAPAPRSEPPDVALDPASDPFAVAAAHAARAAPYDTTAPIVAGRDGAVPASGRGQPGHDDEASIELSVSEQYVLPASAKKEAKKGGVRVGRVLAVSALMLAAGGAGAYWILLRDTLPRVVIGGKPAAAPGAASDVAAPQPGEAPAPSAPPVPPSSAAAAPVDAPAAQAAASSPAPAAAATAPAAPAPSAAAPALKAAPAAARAAEEAREAAAKAAAEKEAAAREAAAKAAAAKEAKEAAAREAAAKAAAAKEAREAAARAAVERDAAAKATMQRDAAAKVETEREGAVAPAPAKPQPAQGLDPAVMQSVIAKSRPEFDACVEKALRDPVTSSFAGRRAALLLLVAPNGKAEAALEDGDLDASPFGACLRRATGKMAFPTFVGEEVGARIVLVLGKAN